MSKEQKHAFEAFARELGKEFGQAAKDIREELKEVKAAVVDGVRSVDKMAGRVAIKAEEVYERFDVNDRLYGAGLGAKAGGIIGVRGGFHGVGIGVVAGSVVGFAIGHKGVQKIRAWRDAHKQSPANDQAPAPVKPNDGPS